MHHPALSEVRARGGRTRLPAPRTLRDDFTRNLRALHDRLNPIWPSPRWLDDPVRFADEVLATELTDEQAKIVESIRDHTSTTVRSGHKCGKSTAISCAALWFYACFDAARVLCTAVKATQVEDIIWREIKRLYRRAQEKRGIDLGGALNETAKFGLQNSDGRQIIGFTARTGEGLAGFSGPNILILADEASGIPDVFFTVLGTSLASEDVAGSVTRRCYISNPTRTSGEFYRSHTSNPEFNRIHISSEDTARAGRPIRGMAGPTWVAKCQREWGVESAEYKVRVLGDFADLEDEKVLSFNAIEEAKVRWYELPDEGELQIGVDPAGDGYEGDETAIAVRRGRKVIAVHADRGLTADAIVVQVLGFLETYRRRGDAPRIAIDVEGSIGATVGPRFRTYLETHEDAFELVELRGGKVMYGSPHYHRFRDALWGEARRFVKCGGALPDDPKLDQEFSTPTLKYDGEQRFRATEKAELRRILRRSPDRADAVCLAIWGFDGAIGGDRSCDAPPPAPRGMGEGPDGDEPVAVLDSYEALRIWERR